MHRTTAVLREMFWLIRNIIGRGISLLMCRLHLNGNGTHVTKVFCCAAQIRLIYDALKLKTKYPIRNMLEVELKYPTYNILTDNNIYAVRSLGQMSPNASRRVSGVHETAKINNF